MLTIAAVTFAAIFIVELPDKTFFAALVLATRYRALNVWIGVSAAFAVQTAVAVALGTAISRLPASGVHIAAGVGFVIGAVWLLLEGLSSRSGTDDESGEEYAEKAAPVTGVRQILTSFVILFAAEWGDLSQILTAVFVSKYHDWVAVFIGALAALVTVSGLAVLLGKQMLRFLRLHVLHFIGATVCAGLGVWTLATAL
jgi:putative Ca2+/H+ antiporter (TMEM165/GDT1 family)